MTDAWGTVTAVDGQYAYLRMDESGCGRCRQPGGCGGNPLGQLLCGPPRTFRVLNPDHCDVGARVRVAVAEGSLGRSALYAYAFPLLALFAGALSGSVCGGEAWAIGGAMGGLLIGWLGLRRAQRQAQQDRRLQLSIRS
jgi:sigma-E factor negative regulatory protein RseC